ncbi:unnamed protein product [Rotaria socialis]|uniref:Peptidyl-prolyl cis-trans isomerase n=1 Tax=Rotaria socialis TaxID=392032 RepID=A0A821BVV6_9BILA|nr:unnamed protein product [Rotaria socialis]CAF3432776.1 unnamed protein product [Rotaria socialis]CAF4600497.1 unnamed protein product [Rotaria socialis]CAF4662781.1 unnamed protein product [Rotaria socialis]
MCYLYGVPPESLPSSFSPPPAPSPPPLIINESELPTASHEIEILLSEKQKLEDEKQNIEKMIKKNEEEINKYINSVSKHCFLGVQIKGKLSDEVLIKLYDDIAPITCSYFRATCTRRYGIDFQNTSLNYLVINKYIEGGEVFAYVQNNNNRILEKREKENNELRHDKAALLSKKKIGDSTKFIITLGAMPSLDGTHIVFGEIIQGFEIFELINKQAVDNLVRAGGASSGGDAADFVVNHLVDIIIYSCGEKQ